MGFFRNRNRIVQDVQRIHVGYKSIHIGLHSIQAVVIFVRIAGWWIPAQMCFILIEWFVIILDSLMHCWTLM